MGMGEEVNLLTERTLNELQELGSDVIFTDPKSELGECNRDVRFLPTSCGSENRERIY